ncbi:HNH endonuclease [Niveibacterium sp. 24ML]|uniref:HNH endonuclease n=1 Tax=Niveibacterium sp. 24ML TaxID=2985512 RepID=UPI002271BFE4|nr:HNH endonuclease [Niveibacterium sp. 24ML]MCX9154611.1 HNH endonuclease [Niveibacterium sp. 24ML]
MTPLDRLRLEKAAADCGFEMQPRGLDDGLEMRSARFPETVTVRQTGPSSFLLMPSTPLLLGLSGDEGHVSVVGFNELYRILRTTAAHARTLPNRIADAFRAQTAKLPTVTEAERLVVQRVGQGIFRDALLDYWQGVCCVTGLAVPQLLRASHIKPWAKCDNDDERLDVFNGLLLAPHIDALFDGGWISFSDTGVVVISDALPAAARTQLMVSSDWRIHGLRASHRRYLAFHRENELRRWK